MGKTTMSMFNMSLIKDYICNMNMLSLSLQYLLTFKVTPNSIQTETYIHFAIVFNRYL